MVVGSCHRACCYDRASWTIFFLHSYSRSPSSLLTIADYAPCLPYLLHALPSLLTHASVVHLLCALRAPFVPASPHRCLMYHRTFCARLPTPLPVYYHAPYTCSLSISTGRSSPVFGRLDFLSNQVAFPSWFASDTCKG